MSSTNENIVKLDVQKLSYHILIIGVISFFMQLMLHNYNISKENSTKSNYSSRHSISDINTIITPEIYHSEVAKNTLEVVNHTVNKADIIKNIDQDRILLPKHDQKDIKKIGNVTVLSITKNTSIAETLNSINILAVKTDQISKIINKKYDLSNFKQGDVVHIINLSKNDSVNFKMTLVNKAEILVKEKAGTYGVSINDLSKKKVVIPSLTLQRRSIVLSNNGIKQSPITQDVKRDLSNIVQLLKQEKFIATKIDVIYEKKSSKNEKLVFVDVVSYNSRVRVYKYLDKTGTMHYVKQNGTLLSRKSKQPLPHINGFKLSYPIHNPIVESGFGMRRHPVVGRVKMHNGIDLRACRGTPIYAPADGIIIEMSNGRGFGKHVRMRHNSTYTTLYAHMHNFAHGKSPGMKVRKGEVIGYVGRTGLTTGEHLHFEVHENGRPINPMRMINNTPIINEKIAVNQLSKKQMINFNSHKADVERKLKLL